MNKRQLLKKIRLSDKDLDEIKTSVKAAEQNTSGEISLALISESSDYSFWELMASLYTAAAVFAIMLPFAKKLKDFYDYVLWIQPVWFLPAFYGLSILVVIAIAFGLFNFPALDRLIIPYSVRHKAVTDRAFRHFAESGVYCTSEHSGILIFVSYMERQVRIIADKGIAEKIPQELWNIIADDLADGIKNGRTKDGFIAAVQKCGELLKEKFPVHDENPNELSDGLAILEN